MIEIKNRYTGEVIVEVEALIKADLYGANLHGADLSEADLSKADLYGADLSNSKRR